jgi:type II secretory pathway pseudopilin PulG
MSEHDARMQAEAQTKAQQAVQVQIQQQMEQYQKQMADRDVAYQKGLQDLETRFQKAATPDQVAVLVTQLMGLKQPIQIVTPTPTKENPNPQPQAVVPQIDFPQAKSYIQNCEECSAARTKLQQDAADRAAQMALAQKQIESLKVERDTWKTTAKGGTTLQRTWKATKWVLVGMGVGAAAVCGSGHCR